jgi:hypothetical protein
MGHYLKEGQTFEEVVQKDTEVLKKAEITHQQVGDALEKVLKSFNWHSARDRGFQKVNDTLSVSAVRYRGFEICPYDNNLTASRDFFISGIPNGNKKGGSAEEPTTVTAMMPDLIRKLHFFEGDVSYGIKPEWAIQIYESVEKDGANIWVPQTQTVYRTGRATTGGAEDLLKEDFCGSQDYKLNPDRVIELAPGVSLYMKGECGVIFAEKRFEFPKGLQIDGLPIDNYGYGLNRGQTFIHKQDIIVG